MVFSTQQTMPVDKDGIEQIAPSRKVVVKENAKGIKYGLEDNK